MIVYKFMLIKLHTIIHFFNGLEKNKTISNKEECGLNGWVILNNV